MNKIAANFGVAFCGLITSMLVAALNTAIAEWTDFNFFTLSFFLIVPAGAVCVGLIAASGYYVGASLLHRRASGLLLVQMLGIAALTHFLMYWLPYQTLVFDGGRRVAEAFTFGEFLSAIMTAGQFEIGGIKTGSVGVFGYVLAVLEFAGLLVGSVAVYKLIEQKAACAPCNRFLRKLHNTRSKYYYDAEAANVYYAGMRQLPVDGPEFGAMAGDHNASKSHQGAFAIHTRLMACPECKVQVLDENVEGFNGQEWKEVTDLKRQFRLPAGLDLAPHFQR